MGFAVSESGCCAVVGEVTEHLTDGLAIVGGAYWGADDSQSSRQPPSPVSMVGFYVAPRLYTEPPGRSRPFGEIAVGFSLSSVPAHAVTFRPSLGIEAVVGRRTQFRTSAGYGLAVGLGKDVGFTVMTALVLIPASGGKLTRFWRVPDLTVARGSQTGRGTANSRLNRRDVPWVNCKLIPDLLTAGPFLGVDARLGPDGRGAARAASATRSGQRHSARNESAGSTRVALRMGR